MKYVNNEIGKILIDDFNKSQGIHPYAINNSQSFKLTPKIDTVSVSVGIEKYDNPNIEIIGDEIVVKLGKVKIGGVK